MARQGSLPRNYHSSSTHRTGKDGPPSHWSSRCVGEGGSRRERKSGAENNRSGKHEFSRLEHCCFLSDQSVVFPPRATSKHSDPITPLEQIVRLIDYSHWASLRTNWSIKLL
jgi:hypothetical protein